MKHVFPDWRYNLNHGPDTVTFPLKPYPDPWMPGRMENGCEVICNTVTGVNYLMVPGSGSHYFELTKKEAVDILEKFGVETPQSYEQLCRTG